MSKQSRTYRETTHEAKEAILAAAQNACLGINADDVPLKEEIDHQVERVRAFLGL